MSTKNLVRMCLFAGLLLLTAAQPPSHSLASVGEAPVSTPHVFVTPAPPALEPAAQARSVSYAYDAAGRLVSADYGGVYILYIYDEAGNLLKQAVLELRRVYLPLVLKN